MILQQALISSELSKHEVLVRIPLEFLDQQIVGRSQRVVLVVADLGREFRYVLEVGVVVLVANEF